MSEFSSGLVAFCYMSDLYEVALFSEPPTDPLYDDMFPVVRLSDAETIIYEKDAEIERLNNECDRLAKAASKNYRDNGLPINEEFYKQAERIKELESDADEEAHIRDRMAQLLAETAVAIK